MSAMEVGAVEAPTARRCRRDGPAHQRCCMAKAKKTKLRDRLVQWRASLIKGTPAKLIDFALAPDAATAAAACPRRRQAIMRASTSRSSAARARLGGPLLSIVITNQMYPAA
jgi:hypothetical protein